MKPNKNQVKTIIEKEIVKEIEREKNKLNDCIERMGKLNKLLSDVNNGKIEAKIIASCPFHQPKWYIEAKSEEENVYTFIERKE